MNELTLTDEDVDRAEGRWDFGYRDRFGFTDPGMLEDPDRVRGPGAKLTPAEKQFIYFWARRKREDILVQMRARHFEACPRCRLCQCGSEHSDQRFMFRCCCSRGVKMFGPNVFRELTEGSSKPYVISSSAR